MKEKLPLPVWPPTGMSRAVIEAVLPSASLPWGAGTVFSSVISAGFHSSLDSCISPPSLRKKNTDCSKWTMHILPTLFWALKEQPHLPVIWTPRELHHFSAEKQKLSTGNTDGGSPVLLHDDSGLHFLSPFRITPSPLRQTSVGASSASTFPFSLPCNSQFCPRPPANPKERVPNDSSSRNGPQD